MDKRGQRLWIVSLLIMAGLFLSVAHEAVAETILSPGAQWEYSFTPDPNWNTTTGGWALGNAPFGNTSTPYNGESNFIAATTWPVNTTLYVRTAVDFTGFNLSTIKWDLGVDNGFTLYANGQYMTTAYAEWFTYRWEYSGDFSGISLNHGVNIIAVELVDRGGLTAFDMQITGDRAPVPLPASAVLFAPGLFGLAAVRRRLKK